MIDDKRLLDNATPGLKRAGFGDRFLALEQKTAAMPGPAVADSEETTAPTTAEFNALLASLRAAGVIKA